jgi:N-acetylglucosaminyldiphosphoundecaprenol N-acetyl-beta-D-mannosaminyltransferase
MPIDAIDMQSCVCRVKAAAALQQPFLISTPNLNFLVNVQDDEDLRESLLQSDLCTIDGAPLMLVAWLLGIPIKNRVAGSDLFEALKTMLNVRKPLKVFFFGGDEGAVAAASRALNARPSGLHCVGSLYPGFGSVDELSRGEIITAINSSQADFLVVSLGAKKGQSWLLRNHAALSIPIRAHLGAVIKFQAGSVRRSPPIMRKLGLEWAWRISEEPFLWRRYWNDGNLFLRVLLTQILPLTIARLWSWATYNWGEQDLIITQSVNHDFIVLHLSGSATTPHIEKIIAAFEAAVILQKKILIDFSNTCLVDARFLGLLLILRKKLKVRSGGPILSGLSAGLVRIFRLNGLDFEPFIARVKHREKSVF